jgi:hypothetical protein
MAGIRDHVTASIGLVRLIHDMLHLHSRRFTSIKDIFPSTAALWGSILAIKSRF